MRAVRPRAGGLAALAALTALTVPSGLPASAAPPAASPSAPQEAAAPPADSSDLDALTARVADRLRCPVCRSQSVLESSSTLAREMKAEIRRRLAEGQTPEQVEAYFVSRYGEWVLLRPEAEGLNLMVYLLPPLLLVGGGLLVWFLLRRWSPRASSATAPGAEGAEVPPATADEAGGAGLSEAEERRLEEALRRGDAGG